MQTVLITGCSSGFGLATAHYFLERDWNVVATMRGPREGLLPESSRLKVLQLDVTDAVSIQTAIHAAGAIDVLVNNAGFGAPAPLELASLQSVRELFETNTFGTLAVTQAVLPQMRARRAGVIVNVSSSATLKPLPLIGAYRAAKAAVNALSESLAAELEDFGIRVRVVSPGSCGETDFRATARTGVRGIDDAVYGTFMQQTLARMGASAGPGTQLIDVAQAIWRAATDPAAPMFIPAGADAERWAAEAALSG
ncbi:SDR family oxidoreductase [Xanthomonas vesicatoria]|uniref:Dehydrogenase n=1 Tax=Xanthomonas vesicatoria TaxID=56460 RepID=A0AAJ0IZ30_9XANT|nr:SDR family oxidoreductase [Xanthomonas vesicatoria]APO96105.1 short-chain dehydrogenase/reductase [Xanthomonas vesicatoria]KHM95116.1 dehydrogenase [Xanthomonas vesicatoria]KHM96517.1 dehydrogenase [Xanthomonas vesicatoria]MCC8622869.1 SDR family oxidoreductase [Xanthomonas vesicatoria]MCC8693830.1 SDR family oxidoreductase [Xanthomonas vesicatoria]